VTRRRQGGARTAGRDAQDNKEHTCTRSHLTDPAHGTIVPETAMSSSAQLGKIVKVDSADDDELERQVNESVNVDEPPQTDMDVP